jgi:branched-chain amino acid transport system permease protein
MLVGIRNKPTVGGKRIENFRKSFATLTWPKAAIAAATIIVLLLPQTTNPYYVKVVAVGLLFAYISSAWNIIGGYGGQLSIGHSIFFGVGSYALGLLLR